MQNPINKPSRKPVSVTELTAWEYCPRKLFIQKILKLPSKLNRAMLLGKIKHQTIELLSNNEEKIIKNIDKDYDKLDLVLIYEKFIRDLVEKIFQDNRRILEGFNITLEEINKKVMSDFSHDLKLRVSSIKDKLKFGFFKDKLWDSLDSLFISELRLESQEHGLKGRVDRIEIVKSTNEIIPYELKTREERIFHSDEIQLTAYSIMLEEHYRTKVARGFIESGTNKQEIKITEELKKEVLDLIEKIRNIENSPPPAMLSNFNKCRSCEFQEECMKL